MWCWPFADGGLFGSRGDSGGLGAGEKLHAGLGVKGLGAVDVAWLQAVGLVVGVWCCVRDELLRAHKRNSSLVVALGQLSELVGGLEAHNFTGGDGFGS